MKIEVTQEDINAGERCSHERCPIALAASRVCKEPKVDSLGALSYRVGSGRDRRHVLLPEVARQFAFLFDLGGRAGLKPLEFEVDL